MIDPQLVWPAPAKLNLMLHITGRRADGYHELQTVFQFLDYGDELEFKLTPGTDVIKRLGNDGIAAQDDLVVRAAEALREKTGVRKGVEIKLNKKLPVGGGLGGGSSDAATTLHALNHLWETRLDTHALAEIGLTLGADIPVFVRGMAAFAEGIGEVLTPVDLEQPWYLVVTPQVHVSTAEIFEDLELTRDCPAIKICDLFGAGWENVCEPVVTKKYPEVKEALAWLRKSADARMSGTGASVFAIFNSEEAALRARDDLPAGWVSFIARGRNISPLMTVLEGL